MNPKNQQLLLTGGAVLLAGAVIAAAVIFSPGKSSLEGELRAVAGGAAEDEQAEISIEGDPVLGSSDAPVTVVEFSDYQCSFCGKFFNETEPQIRENYVATGKVKFVYKDAAFLGAPSNKAAEAAACAQDQGKFWEYHDLLFASQGGHSGYPPEQLKGFAESIGLDVSVFSDCYDSGKYKESINEETSLARSLGVTGTPTFFVNGKKIVGALPYAQFEQAIEAALEERR